MTRYRGISFEIETGLFRRTKGDARIKEMDAGQLEAHRNSLSLDEREDYMGEASYSKELTNWVTSELRQAGFLQVESYKEDLYRVVVVPAPSGGKIHIIGGTMDQPDAAFDGNGHLIGVDPKPTLLAWIFKNSTFDAFCNKVNDTIHRMIAANSKIRLVRKI